MFLSNLPLKDDFDENQAVYSAILFLLQQQNDAVRTNCGIPISVHQRLKILTFIFPQIAQLMPQVFDVLSKAIVDTNVQADIQVGIGTALKTLLTQYTQLQQLVASLSAPQQQAIKNLFV